MIRKEKRAKKKISVNASEAKQTFTSINAAQPLQRGG